ncbi:MBL fold metallo-hydrolase [Paenibacillus sp. WLX1005]|uniref:MBL fold metallo-hydrolase n=1 Tax=Paenibacillus sp. WLX1005 TaxID=3243766 RepID=UPI0039843C4C
MIAKKSWHLRSGGLGSMQLPEITYWEHEIIQVKIAMSYPLRWVNSYLVGGADGWSIIDPGPRTADNEQAWHDVLQQLDIPWSALQSIVLTHHHPDHYGMSGWFQQQTGIPVWLSEKAQAEAIRSWGLDSTAAHDLVLQFNRNGMPDEITSQLPDHLHSFISQVTPQPHLSIIVPGQPLQMGGRTWETIETSGHAAGHISFYEPEQKMIFCGDAVLPQISPNISLIPGSDPHPLHLYLQGLHELGKYEVEQAYPGHRRPFTAFQERTIKLLEHHSERLDKMEHMLRQQPSSGYDICIGLFNSKLSLHQLRFAMSETLAHLAELERCGRIRHEEQNGHIIYAT